MDLIGAIDLLDGGAVRLVQGDYDRVATSVADPEATVRGWVDAGMRHLHLVDLDGAREGMPVNLGRAAAIARAARSETDEALAIELGGGLRTMRDVESSLAAGIDLAILGTAAIADPAFLAEACDTWPGRIAVSVDVRGNRVALDGWTRDVAADTVDLARSLVSAGAAQLIVTDTTRDGTGAGPNVELLGELRAALPGARLVAAGGTASVEHLRAQADIGVDGAIVGLALVDGSLPVEAALDAVRAAA
jgi:phosphoribosylformimino-5-aminoimidazole carboxamide ribotide isomerase